MPRTYLITYRCLKEPCKHNNVKDVDVCCAYCFRNTMTDKTGRKIICSMKCKNLPQLCGRSKRVEM